MKEVGQANLSRGLAPSPDTILLDSINDMLDQTKFFHPQIHGLKMREGGITNTPK